MFKNKYSGLSGADFFILSIESRSVTTKASKHGKLKYTPIAVVLLVSGYAWTVNSFWFCSMNAAMFYHLSYY